MNLLTDLEITKVAFVDAGANPEADILIYKRDISKAAHEYVDENSDGKCDECGMTESEHKQMSKATEPADAKESSVAEDKKFEEAVAKAVAEKVFALEAEHKAYGETIKALDEMDNDTLAALRGITVAPVEKAEDDVLKSLPDDVRERIEKAETAVAKMEAERRTERFAKQAAEFAEVAPVAEIAPVLDALDKADPEVAKSLAQILKAANARIAEGALFTEFGKNDADPDNPVAKIRSKVAEIRKADENLSDADATARVLRENPDLAEAWATSTK